MPTRTPSGAWLAAARQPRLLALLVLLLLAAALCGRLGAWQLDRAAQRAQAASQQAAAELADAPAVPLSEVTAPQRGLTRAQVGRRVSVTGSFDAGAPQFVVPEAGPRGEPGAVVLAAFRVADAGAAVLPVVRGWVPGEPGDWTAELGPAGSLAVPPGERLLVGSLAAAEASAPGSGADGVLGAVSPGQLANIWGSPIYAGSLRLERSQPPEAGSPLGVPPPVAGPGGGIAWQNLAYAAQWWIFGAFAVAVWVRLVRDEAAHLQAAGADDAAAGGDRGRAAAADGGQ